MVGAHGRRGRAARPGVLQPRSASRRSATSEVVESALAPPGVGDAAALEAFDKSLGGRARGSSTTARARRAVVADAVRRVLGRADLDDDEALALALDPAQNRYRLETLNVSTHSPLMRALDHAHYTFRKKLSHTADSPGPATPHGAGLAAAALAHACRARVDVIEPELIARRPGAATRSSARRSRRRGTRARGCSRSASRREHALYVLPNALAVRFEESGIAAPPAPQVDDAHLLERAARDLAARRWTRSSRCARCTRELVRHVGPPCVVRNGLVAPRCTEGTHFCGVPVWRSFPDVERRI